MKKVLCINPPSLPSYFNAGHHLPIFQVGAFLRKNLQATVTAIDAAALNMTWRDMCDVLIAKYDAIAILNDFDSVDLFERFVYYARRLSPNSKLITFGRLSKQIPQWFVGKDIDYVVVSGDYEWGVARSIDTEPNQPVDGVWVTSLGMDQNVKPGFVLPASQWVFPDVLDIPYASYSRLYLNDLNKFCGIPQRQELVVPIARGCPVGCAFCDVPTMQGKKERRVSVLDTLKYIVHSFNELPFEYISFYAPTFTLNREWVLDLCAQFLEQPRAYKWKCVTTLRHLDEGLIEAMARAGCVRISVGIETLSTEGQRYLPKLKHSPQDEVREVASLCSKHGIELNCFVIVGLPGDSLAGVQFSLDFVRKLGARIRPTAFTPYSLMRGDMTPLEISMFNRQLLRHEDCEESEAATYHRLLFASGDDRETQVFNAIPSRSSFV